jgi:hypothetical protein
VNANILSNRVVEHVAADVLIGRKPLISPFINVDYMIDSVYFTKDGVRYQHDDGNQVEKKEDHGDEEADHGEEDGEHHGNEEEAHGDEEDHDEEDGTHQEEEEAEAEGEGHEHARRRLQLVNHLQDHGEEGHSDKFPLSFIMCTSAHFLKRKIENFKLRVPSFLNVFSQQTPTHFSYFYISTGVCKLG